MEKRLKKLGRNTQKLFFDERVDPPHNQDESRFEIMRDKVESAIKTLREGKEFFRLLDEESIRLQIVIFNNICSSGNIPKEQLIWEFII